MAGARHLRGTIFSRVSNLLRSGAIKQKPVWFDVVEAFPPIVATKINRKPETGRAEKIEYPEDYFRRQFYTTYKVYGLLNLKEGEQHPQTDCERFVEKCQEFVKQGMDEGQAFNEASQYFTTELPITHKLHPNRTELLVADVEETEEITNIDDFITNITSTEDKK